MFQFSLNRLLKTFFRSDKHLVSYQPGTLNTYAEVYVGLNLQYPVLQSSLKPKHKILRISVYRIYSYGEARVGIFCHFSFKTPIR
jgi:hypothetical protein